MDTAGRRTTSQKVNKLTKSPTQCPMDIEPVGDRGKGTQNVERRQPLLVEHYQEGKGAQNTERKQLFQFYSGNHAVVKMV